jgi:hypothetical protein
MSEKIKNYLYQNKDSILIFTGAAVILCGLIYMSYKLLEFVSQLSGFSFDPLVLISALILVHFIEKSRKTHQELISEQNKILCKLLEMQKPRLEVKTKPNKITKK